MRRFLGNFKALVSIRCADRVRRSRAGLVRGCRRGFTNTWFYTARRTNPEYFGGFPFLRIDAKNSVGAETYGLHGPITAELISGYVSHGCARMRSQDINRLFWIVKQFASTPVTIQKEVERDANGKKVDVGVAAALFPADRSITFGASVGPRPF